MIFRWINGIGKEIEFLNTPIALFSQWSLLLLAIYMIYELISGVTNRNMEKQKTMIIAVLSLVVTFIMCRLLGMIHYNEQPFAELEQVNQLVFKDVNNSFPSDHTALFFSVIFAFYFCNKASAKWLIVPFAIAFSRVYVGVHYPYDVIAAGIVGIVSAYSMTKLFKQNKILNDSLIKTNEYFKKVKAAG